jgi:hypothetical protein
MATLPLLQSAVRAFYLGAPAGPPIGVQISKNGGPWALASGTLVNIGRGWFRLALAPRDVDTLGPLAYSISGFTQNNQPQDQVVPTYTGVVNQTALNAAFADLSQGFSLNEGLADLLKRPLYQFLISLKSFPYPPPG